MKASVVASLVLSAALSAPVRAQQPSSRQRMRGPAVVVAASPPKIEVGDDVTFTARLRPDLAAEIRLAKPDSTALGPRIIGW
ncbi:MAG: hypothetical protein ACREPM_08965, partial [Gemmatimonadaceae bacterium]